MDNKTLDIFEAMNELYESAQNNLILICNKQLFKNLKNKNWRDIQLSHKAVKELNGLLEEKGKQILENMQKSTLNAFKVAGIKPDKTLIATNEKAMGVVIGSARQYYKGSVTKIWRLDKTDDLYNTILEQSKEGIEKGLPIKINNRNYEYKSYMEMKVRTTISHQIVEQQMELNLDTQNVFFIVNYFGDCAKDHVNLQGKIYYDDRYKSFTIPKEVKDQVANIISQKKLMSMQEAIEKPYWLTTRPNCRHRFVPITIEQALGNTNDLLNKLRLKKGTYKDAKYQASQKLRATERNIRKYKALLNQYQEIYKTGQNSKVLPYIDKYKGLVKKWQKQARIIVDDANSKGYDLERDYRRETRNVIVKDLGVKYNGDDGNPPMQEPELEKTIIKENDNKFTVEAEKFVTGSEKDKSVVNNILNAANEKEKNMINKVLNQYLSDYGIDFSINVLDEGSNSSTSLNTKIIGGKTKFTLNIDIEHLDTEAIYHELGHLIDRTFALNSTVFSNGKMFKGKTLSQIIEKELKSFDFNSFDEEYNTVFKERQENDQELLTIENNISNIKSEIKNLTISNNELDEQIFDALISGDKEKEKEIIKQIEQNEKLIQQYNSVLDEEYSKRAIKIKEISKMTSEHFGTMLGETITAYIAKNGNKTGKAYYIAGHNLSYYEDENKLPTELFAEFFAAKAINDEQTLKIFKKYFPNIYDNLEFIYENIVQVIETGAFEQSLIDELYGRKKKK